jgi:hypothetical protein
MNKIEGLNILNDWKFPTIELLSLDDLEANPSLLTEGISVRLSSKEATDRVDVFLKSIHNVHSLEQIKDFIFKYQNDYNIIIHKTVKPELIGTISKYNNNGVNIIAIELYKDFNDRSHGIVSYRANVEMIGDRIIAIDNDKFISKKLFVDIMYYLRKIDLEDYTFEFVVENGNIKFTDFYTNSISLKKLIKSIFQ